MTMTTTPIDLQTIETALAGGDADTAEALEALDRIRAKLSAHFQEQRASSLALYKLGEALGLQFTTEESHAECVMRAAQAAGTLADALKRQNETLATLDKALTDHGEISVERVHPTSEVSVRAGVYTPGMHWTFARGASLANVLAALADKVRK